MPIKLLLLLPITASAWVISPQHAERCFEKQENTAISSDSPIAELFQATVHDCFNYCVYSAYKSGVECGSIVYHKEQSTCQAYAVVRNRRETYKEEKLVDVQSHDFYARTSFDGHCSAPREQPFARARAANTFNWANQKETAPIPLPYDKLQGIEQKEASFMEAIFRSEKAKEEEDYEYDEDRKDTKTQGEQTVSPVEKTTPESKTSQEFLDKQGEDLADVVSQSGIDEIYSKAFQNSFKEGILFPHPNQEPSCPNDAIVSYFVLFGYSLLSPVAPSTSLKAVDQNTCFRECSQNKNDKGNEVGCVAANYDLTNGECSIFGPSAKAERRQAIIMENEQIMYADKFCLKTAKSCSPDTPYIVYSFKQIHRKIIDWHSQVFSPVDCLSRCVDHSRCKAVTYKEGLCIIHSESPIGDPSLLIDGSTETMVIENGCQLMSDSVVSELLSSLEQQDELGQLNQPGEWEEWSGCVFGGSKYSPSGQGGRVRVRHRECPDGAACEDLEVEKCQ